MYRLALGISLSVLLASAASAQPVRTFVSGLGSDAASCGRIDPCRSFPVAVAAVATGGEVIALDSAGYGPFTVTRAVAVIAPPGVHAAIAATAGAAITVNAAGANVILRGLYINTPSGGVTGVNVIAAAAVNVENSVVNGFSGNGLYAGSPGSIVITDCTFRNLSSGVVLGAAAFFSQATLLIDHSRFEYCSFSGITIFQGGEAVARDTVTSNGQYGFVAQSNTAFGPLGTVSLVLERCSASHNSGSGILGTGNGGTVYLDVTDSVSSYNGAGISQGIGTVRVSRSTFVRNASGVVGTVLSRGDNTLEDNFIAGSFGAYSAK